MKKGQIIFFKRHKRLLCIKLWSKNFLSNILYFTLGTSMFNDATFWEVFLPFVASLNILVQDKINVLYYEHWTDNQKYFYINSLFLLYNVSGLTIGTIAQYTNVFASDLSFLVKTKQDCSAWLTTKKWNSMLIELFPWCYFILNLVISFWIMTHHTKDLIFFWDSQPLKELIFPYFDIRFSTRNTRLHWMKRMFFETKNVSQ